MAHVEKRRGKWVAVYPDPARKSGRGAKTFDRKIDADRFLAVTVSAQLHGDWIDPKAGKITVKEYGESWLTRRRLRPSTRERYGRYLERHINDMGGWQLAQLTPQALADWQAAMVRDGIAESTTSVVRAVFSAMLTSAVDERLLIVNPWRRVPRLVPAATLIHPLSLDVVLSIRDTIAPKYGAAIMVGAGCGLRFSECMGLTVDRVDFLRRTIRVDRQLVDIVDGAPVFGPPKTNASARLVPMPHAVVDALAAHLARWPAADHGLIFTAPRGGVVRREAFYRSWHASKAPAGARFHDLRHFYASTLIEGGRSVKEVQARLGHSSAVLTLTTYAHLWPDNEDGTRAAIDAAFAPKPREGIDDVTEAGE